MTFDYNTTRKKLILAEYGRNVQNMVAYICTLPTKEERNRYSQVVIDLMGFLNPHLRDVADFKHKLWDHLQIISDFKIDVDSPYPIPSEDAINFKPDPLAYPQKRIRFKHYGKTVEIMIERARELDDPAQRQHLTHAIANFMKMAYVTWNKDSVADETIFTDLREMSKGELIPDANFSLSKVEAISQYNPAKQKTPARTNTLNKKSKNNQSNRPKYSGKRY